MLFIVLGCVIVVLNPTDLVVNNVSGYILARLGIPLSNDF